MTCSFPGWVCCFWGGKVWPSVAIGENNEKEEDFASLFLQRN